MKLFYILKDKVPVVVDDVITWGQWMDDNQFTEGRVGDDMVEGIRVSTVFTGINAAMSEPPKVFETAIFESGDLTIIKSCTWEEAKLEHQMAIERLEGERCQ